MAITRTAEVEYSGIPWFLVLIEGIAAIIVGLFLFMRPAATLVVLIQFLGIYWLITGIFALISLLWDRSAWGWKLFSGILGILAGIMIVQNPLWSTLFVPATLAIMVGIIGIMIGVFQLISAFSGGGWGTGILGILSILLGFLLIGRPVLAGLALPWILGGLLLFGGLLAIVAAFGLRDLEKQAKEARMEAARRVPSGEPRSEPAGMMDTSAGAPVAATAGAVGLAAAGVDASISSGEDVSEVASTPVESVPVATTESVETSSSVEAEIPEAELTGNVDTADPTEMAKFKYALEYVEGIGPAYGAQLKEMGLVTCLDLLKSGASRKGREEIVERSGISGKLILKWVNHVDLYRIKGVGSEYADLLEASGVDTVVEMAQRNPDNLFEKMNELNMAKALVRHMPTLLQVEDWVSQAKTLPRVVNY